MQKTEDGLKLCFSCSDVFLVKSVAYRCLMKCAFPNNLHRSVLRRMHKIGTVDVSKTLSLTLATHVRSCVGQKSHTMCIIKTWTSSCFTSYRYHELILLPCLLGCPEGKDDLSHCVDCIRMQIILEALIHDTPSAPLKSIGLQRVTKGLVLSCAAAFAV